MQRVYRCQCGRPRSQSAAMCWICFEAVRPRALVSRCRAVKALGAARRYAAAKGRPHICKCGKACSASATKCRSCYADEKARSVCVCLQCGQSFRPRRAVNHAKGAFNTYCSRACYFAGKRLRATAARLDEAAALEERRIKRAFARHFAAELRRRLPAEVTVQGRFCRCGAPITQARTGACQTCLSPARAASARASLSVARVLGAAHVCANCGQSFRGNVSAVHCSRRCANQMHRRQGRGHYPAIGHIPLAERNRVAELIALVRRANRRIHDYSAKGG